MSRIRHSRAHTHASAALLTLLTLGACKADPPPPTDVKPPPADVKPTPPAEVKPTPPAAPAQCAGNAYKPVGNVEHYFKIALDVRDLRAAMSTGDWAAATNHYQNGKHQTRADGTVRSLMSMALGVEKWIPNGAVYARAAYVDQAIRDGLKGVGRAHGNSDPVRRHAVDIGVQWIIYGKVLEELQKTSEHIAAKKLDAEDGAPHTVDEAWAALAGEADERGARSYAVLASAALLEESEGLQGKLCAPLENAFIAGLGAAQKGDAAAWEKLRPEILGRVHAIFYRRILRAAHLLEADATEEARQQHMAEAWSTWQILRSTVSAASPSAAQAVEALLTRSSATPFTPQESAALRSALHEAAVWSALAIPAELKAS